MSEKKVEKKVIFIFANFFFKIIFGHFLCPISKIKKVLKTSIFSIFLNFKKLLFILQKLIFHVFFMEIAFSGELLVIYIFLILIYFNLIDNLSFFILLMKKKFLIKYFFIINVPIIYPPLSKKS